MDKHLHLKTAFLFQKRRFLQRKLPRRNHPDDTKPLQGLRSRRIRDGHLGARVQRKMGKVLSKNAERSHILHDHSVQSRLIKRGDEIRKPVQLLLLHERVDRQINLFPIKMGLIQRGKHFVPAEISGIRPRSILLAPYVHCIRPRLQRRLKAAIIPGGCKKFRFLHSAFPFISY